MSGRYSYDHGFMSRTAEQAETSASKIIGVIRQFLLVESVLDVGCAVGGWVRAWSLDGAGVTHGVDGEYVKQNDLLIPQSDFFAKDLNQPFDLGRRYDLVQTLDVAEHLRPENSDAFLNSLDRHCTKAIMFGAAPPGQGGEYHINEQSLEFWRRKIEIRGYTTFDCIRPLIRNDRAIPFWYRFNVLLYIRNELVSGLPQEIMRFRLAPDVGVKDFSPLSFQFRKALLRFLPVLIVTWLSKRKTQMLTG